MLWWGRTAHLVAKAESTSVIGFYISRNTFFFCPPKLCDQVSIFVPLIRATESLTAVWGDRSRGPGPSCQYIPGWLHSHSQLTCTELQGGVKSRKNMQTPHISPSIPVLNNRKSAASKWWDCAFIRKQTLFSFNIEVDTFGSESRCDVTRLLHNLFFNKTYCLCIVIDY